jgi:hypothetical protein
MARLLEVQETQQGLAPETDEDQTKANEEALSALELQEDNPTPEDTPEDIPEKYQGKSTAELVRMHQESERKIGTQGSEVGDLRKLVDQYITAQTVDQAPTPSPVEDDADWFTDPDKALAQKLDNHPTIKKMEKDSLAAAQAASRASLELKHPDFRDIMQDGEFAKWIGKSKTRSRLFVEADKGYDTESADELFSNWKERKALTAATTNADKATRKEDLRQASTGGARGSSTPAAKKKYRRTDIINLMTNDPERYQQLAPEILLAYKEKRVY